MPEANKPRGEEIETLSGETKTGERGRATDTARQGGRVGAARQGGHRGEDAQTHKCAEAPMRRGIGGAVKLCHAMPGFERIILCMRIHVGVLFAGVGASASRSRSPQSTNTPPPAATFAAESAVNKSRTVLNHKRHATWWQFMAGPQYFVRWKRARFVSDVSRLLTPEPTKSPVLRTCGMPNISSENCTKEKQICLRVVIRNSAFFSKQNVVIFYFLLINTSSKT